MKRARDEEDDGTGDGTGDVTEQQASHVDEFLADTSDVQLVLTSLVHETFAATAYDVCRGVFLHQLYACLGNKTLVDAEVAHLLRDRKTLKVLASTATIKGRRPSPTVECEVLIPLTTYVADIERSGVHRFVDIARLHASKAQVLASELVAARAGALGVFSAADVADAVKAGFLYRKGTSMGSDVVYAFSHPMLRRHQQRVDAARATVVALVKSTRGKEMAQRALKKKLGDTQPFGFRFVALDALGLGVLEKMQSTSDVFYRVPVER